MTRVLKGPSFPIVQSTNRLLEQYKGYIQITKDIPYQNTVQLHNIVVYQVSSSEGMQKSSLQMTPAR